MTEDLPVDVLRGEVEAALAAGLHLVIQAPTGSGKSTRVPLWCRGRVLVVEPRRVACRSLARYMSAQEDRPLGSEIGYAIRFETVADQDTRILFVTPGVALREAVEGALARYDAIIVDEFHERGLESDLFLALARRLAPAARILVMSATLRAERLVDWLGARVLASEGRLFPVEIRYLGGPTVPSSHHLADRVAEGVRRALSETPGNILVFVPGRGDIQDCISRLRRLPAPGGSLEVLPLHGSLSHEEQDRAFEPQPPGGRRRVVVSTNVAETSVTLPGVTAVVDSGLVRQRRHRGGHPTLGVIPVSRASADQRAGRAGRVAPGVCYRLWDARSILEPETPPEVLREDLTSFVLAVAATGFRPQDLDFLDAPPAFAVERAQEQLRAWGVTDGHDRLTSFGQRLERVPLDPALARLVVEAPDTLRRDVIDLVASLEARVPLARGGDPDDDLPRCDGLRNILALREGGQDEAHRIADQLREIYGLGRLARDRGRKPRREDLVAWLLRQWPERAYVRRVKSHAWGNGQDEVVLSSSSMLASERSRRGDEALEKAPQAAILLEIEALGDRGLRTKLSCRTAMPCQLADLRAAGLGRPVAGRVGIQGDEVVGEVTWTYAGREIGSETRALSGAVLREALADLVLRGTLFKGAGSRLADDVEAFNLAQALGEGETRPVDGRATLDAGPGAARRGLGAGTAPVDARAWLVARLEALGVEAPTDHLLLEPADLVFPGLDEAARRDLDERFPRRLSAGNATWQVAYDPRLRLVTLNWEGGQKNPRLGRMALPRWPGWEVQICERGRVTGLPP